MAFVLDKRMSVATPLSCQTRMGLPHVTDTPSATHEITPTECSPSGLKNSDGGASAVDRASRHDRRGSSDRQASRSVRLPRESSQSLMRGAGRKHKSNPDGKDSWDRLISRPPPASKPVVDHWEKAICGDLQ